MRILICPLDWGLGHATRCIPLIRAFRSAGHEVMVYASGAGYRLLRAEFPGLQIGRLPGYAMRYSRHRFLLPFWLLLQLPLFLLSAVADRFRAASLARRHDADLVISDGRYGFRTVRAPCVFITHQLCLLPPLPRKAREGMLPWLTALNRLALRGFAQIWVPDFQGHRNLSGRLGHPALPWRNVRYAGPLCRFRSENSSWASPAEMESTGQRLDVLALVSGPEPQRSLFEQALLAALDTMSGTRVLVRGLPGEGKAVPREVAPGTLAVFDHLPEPALLSMLAGADKVVCRSGYTTVMELAGLGKKNILVVPTPGQPEQEYLAVHLRELGLAHFQAQENLALAEGLEKAGELAGFASLYHGEKEERGRRSLADFLSGNPLIRQGQSRPVL